jgi:branched-chain amino acid aminotransferase
VAPSGLDPRHAIGEPTVIVAAFPFGPHARPSGQGVRAKIVSTRRIPPQCLDPKIKQANYLNEIFAKQEAINSGMDEALMLDVDGFLAEAPAANIFLVKDESLYTPPLKYILAGITRQTVLEIARDEQIPAFEVELTVADLFSADEAILTGTGAGLAALIEVDKRPIGNGLPGPMLQKLKVLYERKVDEDSIPLF